MVKSQEAEVQDDADEIKVILLTSVYGYHIFDNILFKENSNKDNELLYLNNNIEYAKGILTDEGFVILKGSKLKKQISNSLSPSLMKYAERTQF